MTAASPSISRPEACITRGIFSYRGNSRVKPGFPTLKTAESTVRQRLQGRRWDVWFGIWYLPAGWLALLRGTDMVNASFSVAGTI